MMKLKNWWFLIFSILASVAVHGQSAAETYAQAVQEESTGKYAEALQKYQRIMFFKPDTLMVAINVHCGNCRLGLGEYKAAINSYDNALIVETDKREKNRILVQKLKAAILGRNMNMARRTIQDIDTLKDTLARREVVFYQGVIYFYLENYDLAEDSWLKLVANDTVKTKELKDLFARNARIDRLKPGIAIALSVVLPGAGQVYAGDVKEGLNSLLLNGALFFLGYNTAIVYQLYNALIAVGPWYLRYYEGGFLKAGEMVRVRRAQRHLSIYYRALEILQQP